jgi:glycosyltransferase involved in cell wall biosynthesis
VIIPALDEAQRLPGVLAGIRGVDPSLTILVVDDGSRDGTPQAARAAGARVAVHPFNLGYGAALQTGYRFAVANGFGLVIQMDADGQHDPRSIPAIRAACLEGADLVLGSRFLGSGSYRPPRMRAIGIHLFGWLASRLLGQRIRDATTGYQGLSARLCAFHARSHSFPHDYPDANMIVRAGRAGFRITEVPVLMRADPQGGKLHVGLKPIAYVLKMLVAVALEASRRRAAGEE